MKSSFSSVAATVFTVVSLLHLTRIVFGWEVQIGTSTIPFWVSWAGTFIPAGLAVWGFTLMGTQQRDRTA